MPGRNTTIMTCRVICKAEAKKKDLVRFHYENELEVFDAVSYNKGGRILHMLRNYVGDSAFSRALNLYLTTNKFKSAEVPQLRLAFEEVTGRDLNRYFNQWYYNSGHPVSEISYLYDDAAGYAKVIVKQTQKTGMYYRLPLKIDIYNGSVKKPGTWYGPIQIQILSHLNILSVPILSM